MKGSEIRDNFAGVLLTHSARIGRSVNGSRRWLFCTCDPDHEIRGSGIHRASVDGAWTGKAEESHYLHVAEVLAEVVGTDRVVGHLAEMHDLNERMAGELERLGKGIERVVAKHGADHPEMADALHRLLRTLERPCE